MTPVVKFGRKMTLLDSSTPAERLAKKKRTPTRLARFVSESTFLFFLFACYPISEFVSLTHTIKLFFENQ